MTVANGVPPVAVVSSVMLAAGAFYLATAEALHALAYLARRADAVPILESARRWRRAR